MRICFFVLLMPLMALAQDWFAGGFAGISTLSADAQSDFAAGSIARISQYKPENGPAAMAFFGRHWNGYFSTQATYGWNANDVELLSATTDGLFGQMPYRARMQTVLGEGMLYFRNRGSAVRPYLSAGFGVAHLDAETQARTGIPTAVLPATRVIAFARQFSAAKPAFRAAVGIDLRLRAGFAFRYSFAETIQGNAISAPLQPQGKRNLANFQNLFGFLWHF